MVKKSNERNFYGQFFWQKKKKSITQLHGKILNLQITDSFSYSFWFICYKIYKYWLPERNLII